MRDSVLSRVVLYTAELTLILTLSQHGPTKIPSVNESWLAQALAN